MSDEQDDNQNGDAPEAPKPKRGRPKQPKVDRRGEMEARALAIQEEIRNRPPQKVRSLDEMVQFNFQLMSRLQDILWEDFQTIGIRNTALMMTPNGVARTEVAGLTNATREHLVDMFDMLAKTIILAIEAQQGKKDEGVDPNDKFKNLAALLSKGVPGIKFPGSNQQ